MGMIVCDTGVNAEAGVQAVRRALPRAAGEAPGAVFGLCRDDG